MLRRFFVLSILCLMINSFSAFGLSDKSPARLPSQVADESSFSTTCEKVSLSDGVMGNALFANLMLSNDDDSVSGLISENGGILYDRAVCLRQWVPKNIFPSSLNAYGQVKWYINNPAAYGYSQKGEFTDSENPNDLRCTKAYYGQTSALVDGVYNVSKPSWRNKVLKVPDHCTVKISANGFAGFCCSIAGMAAARLKGLDTLPSVKNPRQLAGWPNNGRSCR